MNDEGTLPGGDFRLFLQKIAMQGFYLQTPRLEESETGEGAR